MKQFIKDSCKAGSPKNSALEKADMNIAESIGERLEFSCLVTREEAAERRSILERIVCFEIAKSVGFETSSSAKELRTTAKV